jgi:outer membrane protein
MTRKFMYVTLVLAFFCTLSAFAQATPAPAASSGTKIGIINLEEAILTSNEGQRDFNALMAKYKAPNDELQTRSKELDDLRNQLKTQGSVMSEEKRAELAGTIQEKEKNAQRFFDDNQSKVQKEQGEIYNRIGQKLVKVIDTYAQNNAFSVILDDSAPQSPVLWANVPAGVVITRQIVEAYNVQSGVPAQPKVAGAAPAGAAPRPGGAVARPGGTTAPKPAGTTTTPK